jgi:energy-coupling factor transporter ATP-binding protein EcfA2
MIKIKNLTYTYPSSQQPALKDVGLEVKDGEFVLIKGDSGSGKSTLLYCINGLIPHIFEGSLIGEIEVNGFNPKDLPIWQISKKVGTVFQNPENQIFMPTVKEDIVFGCRNLRFTEEEIEKRLNISLEELDLIHIKHKSTDELSNGQKQRLAIAGIYAMAPNIFLFDESTTDLDAKGKLDFLEILKKIKAKGSTIILAEHDSEYLEDLADKKVVLKDGTISKEDKIAKFDTSFFYNKKGSFSLPWIKLEEVCFGYDGKTDVLKDIGLEIRKGEFVAIIGNNGSGKTTLFKLIIGVLKAQKGRIFINGLSKYCLDNLIGKVGFLFQNPDEQLFTNKVEEEISFGPRQLKIDFDLGRHLNYFGLEKYRDVHPHLLSRGERQRLAFISILAMQPDVIILDEPTTGLDQNNWIKLMDFAVQLNSQGKTIVFSTHNMKVVEKYAQRIIKLEEGHIVLDEIRV